MLFRSGASIRTTAAGSSVTVAAVGSVIHAATAAALGDSSQLAIQSERSFQLLQGGILQVSGDDSRMTIDGGRYLSIAAGSAILAGVVFEQQNGSPVPVAVGADSQITLTAPGELWLAGSVSSTGSMTFNAGKKEFDHAEYFDTIPGRVLGTAAIDQDQVNALRSEIVPSEIRDRKSTRLNSSHT